MRRVLVADDCPTCKGSGQGGWEIVTPQGEQRVCPDCLGTCNQETWIPWEAFVAMVMQEPLPTLPDEPEQVVRWRNDTDRGNKGSAIRKHI